MNIISGETVALAILQEIKEFFCGSESNHETQEALLCYELQSIE